jgi:hypothetical protein
MTQKKYIHMFNNALDCPQLNEEISESDYKYMKHMALKVFSKSPFATVKVTKSDINISFVFDDEALKLLLDVRNAKTSTYQQDAIERFSEYCDCIPLDSKK